MHAAHQRICLDIQGAQSGAHFDRGIPRYIVEHTQALTRLHPEAIDSILLNPREPLTGNLDWALGHDRLRWVSSDRRIGHIPATRPLVYHIMSPFQLERSLDELWPMWARGNGVRTVVTLYDLIPLVFPEQYLRDPVMRARYQTRCELVRRCEHVLAISEATARDAIERLGVDQRRVTVINAGATETFGPMYSDGSSAMAALSTAVPQIRPGFVLYVGGFEFRKNLARLIDGYGLLPRETRAAHQLVIACRLLPSEAAELRSRATGAGLHDSELVLTGYVPDATLGALYHACQLFVFPSLYEGSGLPILEAMACGAAVAASRTSTTPEILGDDDGTFDPLDVSSIASSMASLLEDAAALDRLRERSRRRVTRYTWNRVAENSMVGYERALSAPRRSARRSRIALVTPWPPERSGIADYSWRLATELGKHVDVDVIVASDVDQYAPVREANLRLVPWTQFRAVNELRSADRVVYCMGNSSFHGHVYELMRTRPGAVVAHDVRLTGFYGWFAGRERPEDPVARLRERIAAQYGPRLPPAVYAAGPPDPQVQAALGIYMTREIQEYAEQLLVHSSYAAEILALDRAPTDRAAPIEVIPFAFPDPPPKPSTHADGHTIVTVGVVSEVKGLATLIEAFALISADRPETRLVIAGPAEAAELERWRAHAADVAPEATIEIPGYLERDEYQSLLAQSSAAVQLRMHSNGEASASIADCLAASLPTIASDHGWVSELPAGTILTIRPGGNSATVAAAIESLLSDDRLRTNLSDAAGAYAHRNRFAAVAEAYLSVLALG